MSVFHGVAVNAVTAQDREISSGTQNNGPTAPATATAPPKLEICDLDGSKCKLLNAR